MATTTREELETTQSTVEIIEDITTAVAEPLLLAPDDGGDVPDAAVDGRVQHTRDPDGRSGLRLWGGQEELAHEGPDGLCPGVGRDHDLVDEVGAGVMHRAVEGHDGGDLGVVRLEGLVGVVEDQVAAPVQVGVLELGHDPDTFNQSYDENDLLLNGASCS